MCQSFDERHEYRERDLNIFCHYSVIDLMDSEIEAQDKISLPRVRPDELRELEKMINVEEYPIL